MRSFADTIAVVASAMLTCGLVSSAGAASMTCVVGDPQEDEPPSFIIDTAQKTVGWSHSEGSRSGDAKFAELDGEIAIAVVLGPVTQGGNVLSDKQDLATLYVGKDKKLVGVVAGATIEGNCE